MSTLTPKQRRLRIGTFVLLCLILAMIIAGDGWLAPLSPFATMAYWMLAFAFGIGVILLVLLDFREIGRAYLEGKRRILDESIRKKEDDDE